jgi:hypothetical protein
MDACEPSAAQDEVANDNEFAKRYTSMTLGSYDSFRSTHRSGALGFGPFSMALAVHVG